MLLREKILFKIVLFKNARKTQKLHILWGKMSQNVIFCVQNFFQNLLFKNNFFSKMVLLRKKFSSKSFFLRIYFSLKSDAS